MYGDEHFFELPIYLEKESKYYGRFEEILEHVTVEAHRRTGDPRKDLEWHRVRTERWREIYLKGYGGWWHYNQIFGFLGIYPLGDQLRGATWYTTKKLARRDIGKKAINLYGKAFEMTVRPEMSSRAIFDELRSEVRKLCRERPYNRRFLDTTTLDLAGPFLDWRRIMDISTRRGLHGLKAANVGTFIEEETSCESGAERL